MKKLKLSISFVITSIVTAVYLIIITQKYDIDSNIRTEYNNPRNQSENSTSPGNEEDPTAFAKEEYFRLRNPQTGKIPSGIVGKELEFAKTIPTIEEIRYNKSTNRETYSPHGWKQRGPWNVGGRTRAFGVDVRNDNILIAGSASGGIWKSVDGGTSWQKKTKPDQLHSSSYLIQDTRVGEEDTWYCATGEVSGGNDMARDYLPYRGDGIYKSTDNGESWELIPSTSTSRYQSNMSFSWVHKLAIDNSKLSETVIYAATMGAIRRSADGGNSWNIVLGNPYSSGYYSNVTVTSTGVVYAAISYGTDKGIWCSENGVSWTNITPSSLPSNFGRIRIAAAPSNENVVYFMIDVTDQSTWDWTDLSTMNSKTKFYKYTYFAGNGVWEDRSANFPYSYSFQTGLGYTMILDVYPENENIVFAGGTQLWRSNDGFATSNNKRQIGGYWREYYHSHLDFHEIVFSPNNSRIAYTAHDGGVSKTNDILGNPPQWEQLSHGYITTQFYTVGIAQNLANDKRIIAGSHDHGIYVTDNDDYTIKWNYIHQSDGAYSGIIDNGTKYFFSWHIDANTYLLDNIPGDLYEVVYRLGYTPYEFIYTKISPPVEDPLLIPPIVTDPNDDKIFYLAGGKDLWRNTNVTAIPLDRSQSAKMQNWSIVTSCSFYTKITAIGAAKEPANRVYYGTRHGQVMRIEDASVNNPTITPVYINKGFPQNAYVSNIAVDPHDGDHVLLTFCNYQVKSIFATWDGGQTWSDISGNLEQIPSGLGNGPAVYWVAILFEQGANTYFAGTSTGLYSTRNLDETNTVWAQEGAETIGNINVKMIATREVDGEVVIATYGRGIFSRDFSVTDIQDNEAELPNNFMLYQNYPNPFNPATTINYRLPRTAEVEIVVYDMLGRKIKTLVNNELNAGFHEITWNGTNELGDKVTSGIYFYTMRTEDFIDTKKLLLLK